MSAQVYQGELANGWCSDVGNPPQLGEIVLSMQSQRSYPLPLLLEVNDPAGENEAGTLLPIRATALRTVYPPDWDTPEFEFDGYVVGRAGVDEVWVRGALRTNGETAIKECTLYRLDPGAESGLRRTVESG